MQSRTIDLKALVAPCLFGLIYGCAVTLLSFILEGSPFLIQVENSFYDPLQQNTVLRPENYDFSYREKFTKELEKVWLINLDQEIYSDTDEGIDKKRLTLLMKRVNEFESTRAVFLDYLYATPSRDSDEDEMLKGELVKLYPKLVLPYGYSSAPNGGYFDYLDSSEVDCRTELYFEGAAMGHSQAEHLPYGEKYRYLRLEIPSRGFKSCALLLAEMTHPQIARRLSSTIQNQQMEINYVCDNPSVETKKIFHLSQAGDLLNHFHREKEKIRQAQPELILIGRFEPMTTSSCRPLEVSKTPINGQLFQTMITLNAWLNIVTNGYLKRNNLWQLFLFNLILGILGGFWAMKFPNSSKKRFWHLALEVFGIIVLFSFILIAVYLNWNMRISFAIPLIVFVQCEFLARKFFMSYSSTQSRHHDDH